MAAGADAEFEALITKVTELKNQIVQPRISWYETHTAWPRLWFRVCGTATIVLSAILPALSTAPSFPHQRALLAVVSITVASLTGLGTFYRWERTWHGNSMAKTTLEQHVAKWELELENARCMLPSDQRLKHVYQATDDLMTNAAAVVSTETEGFFSNLQPPQNSSGQSK